MFFAWIDILVFHTKQGPHSHKVFDRHLNLKDILAFDEKQELLSFDQPGRKRQIRHICSQKHSQVLIYRLSWSLVLSWTSLGYSNTGIIVTLFDIKRHLSHFLLCQDEWREAEEEGPRDLEREREEPGRTWMEESETMDLKKWKVYVCKIVHDWLQVDDICWICTHWLLSVCAHWLLSICTHWW